MNDTVDENEIKILNAFAAVHPRVHRDTDIRYTRVTG